MQLLPLTASEPSGLSALLWSLSRPVPSETNFYCGWHQHPQTGQYALLLPEGDTQPVHKQAEANIQALAAAIAPFISAAEKQTLIETLLAARGKRVEIIAVLPASLAGRLVDEADAGDWFAFD